jgi:putative ubiquitin-RnfH superfamily antitoxin RatB of RatAB toxin-antitoxin module
VLALGNFESIGRFEVVAGHDVVDVVDTTGSHPDFGEIDWPNSSVGIFALILREVRGIDVVVNVS